LKLLSLDRKVKEGDYYSFVYPYLYYLDTTFDNRDDKDNQHVVNGKSSLMLVPLGAKKLKKINFWNSEINYCVYTNSILDFYAKPT